MTPTLHSDDLEIDLNTRLSRLEGKIDMLLSDRSCHDHEERLRKLESRMIWFRGGLAALSAVLALVLAYFKFKDH